MNGKLSPSNFFILNLTSTFINKHILLENSFQTLVNRGPDSIFVDEANSTRLSPKLKQSGVIKSMVQTLVTLARGKA